MPQRICCVSSCAASLIEGAVLHAFPNPEKEPEKFRIWVNNAGLHGEGDAYIFKNRRICRIHFEENYHYPKNRLSILASPTLHLSDLPIPTSTMQSDQVLSTATANTYFVAKSQKTLHSFPNPKVKRELFNTWVFAIGGSIIGLEEDFIFKERRVCRAHFEEKYHCRCNRLSNIATPTLNLPGFMKATTTPLVGRRPLASLQPTPESLASTSSDLQYDFHIFNDEVKENIDVVMHTFPNPNKHLERFKTWVSVVGGDCETLSHDDIFKKKRICDIHFTDIYRNRYKRLSACAVPSLHLPSTSGAQESIAAVEADPVVPVLVPDQEEDDNLPVDQTDDNLPVDQTDDNLLVDQTDDNLPVEQAPSPEPCQFSWQKSSQISVDDYEDDDDSEDYHLNAVPLKMDVTEEIADDVDEDNKCVPKKIMTQHSSDAECIKNVHKEYCCDNCTKEIVGYTCVECDNYDLCGACEGRLAHAQHYMLRVSRPRPASEIKAIIDAIRVKIKMLTEELQGNTMDIEIKEELIDMVQTGDTTKDTDVLNQIKLREKDQIIPEVDDICEELFESEEWLDDDLLELGGDTDESVTNKQTRSTPLQPAKYRPRGKLKNAEPNENEDYPDPLSTNKSREKIPTKRRRLSQNVGLVFHSELEQVLNEILTTNPHIVEKDGTIHVEKEVKTEKGNVKKRFLVNIVRPSPS